MSALIPYIVPPAVARAYVQRGYTSLTLEAHQEAIARRARMEPPKKPRVAALPPPPPPPPPPKPKPEPKPPEPKPARLTLRDVINRIVSIETGISVDVMLGDRRKQPVVAARMTAMWLQRAMLPDMTTSKVGRNFYRESTGRARDHSTIYHAVNVISKRLKDDLLYQERVKIMWETINEQLAEWFNRKPIKFNIVLPEKQLAMDEKAVWARAKRLAKKNGRDHAPRQAELSPTVLRIAPENAATPRAYRRKEIMSPPQSARLHTRAQNWSR